VVIQLRLSRLRLIEGTVEGHPKAALYLKIKLIAVVQVRAGGPGFYIPPSVPRNDVGCPILCAESRGRFSHEICSAQRVGDNYPPTLTGPSSPNQ
jgi:hypothetical protein